MSADNESIVRRSQSIAKISNALFAFQTKMSTVVIDKDTENKFLKNRYASLANIIKKIQPVLTECGLCFTQHPGENNTLTSLLMHAESGEFMESVYKWETDNKTPQGSGSAITYARRYCLSAILGIVTEDDDDGNAGSGVNGKNNAQQQGGQQQQQGNNQQQQGTKQELPPKLSQETIQQWRDALAACKNKEDIVKLYDGNKKTAESYPEVKALFTERKVQLGIK